MSHSRRLRRLLASTSVLAIGLYLQPAHAGGPTGGSVVAGQAAITTPSATSTVINQSTERAVINWQDFSISLGSSATFNQPNASAITLNRVVGPTPSAIDGSIFASGRVWLINGNGILFGKGSVINVGSLIATTADIANNDFMNGSGNFSGASANPNAAITNNGSIIAHQGGSIILAGPVVTNNGLIQADVGNVVLAGANAFTVDFQGDKLIQFAITTPVSKTPTDPSGKAQGALVTNSGTIAAAGGQVVMTARAAQSVADNVVNNSGVIEASSAHQEGGTIVLDSGAGGETDVGGSVNATGTTGGSITATGSTVKVADGATINASGTSGGGTIQIGGSLHGQGPLQNATTTTIGQAKISADAIQTGNGGHVVVWSNQNTQVNGTISARGGQQGGNGGTVETSGHQLGISTSASVDTGAPKGIAGNWLLDPAILNIQNGGTDLPDGTGTIAVGTSPGSTFTVAPSTITTALGSENVTLEATSQINVYNDVVYSSANTLSLLSEGSINVQANIQNTLATSGGGINLVAGWDGLTTAQGSLANAGVFGNGATGTVTVGAASGSNIAVGAASGSTLVEGANVTLDSTSGYAQIGYHGGGGGAIFVNATGNLTIVGQATPGQYAVIGNGTLGADVTSNVTGDITIDVGGTTSLEGSGAAGEPAWIGNETSGAGTALGNVSLVTGLEQEINSSSSLGNIIGADLHGGSFTYGETAGPVALTNAFLFTSSYNLTLLSTGNVVISNSIENSGTGNITLVGGWDGKTLGAGLLQSGTYGNNSGSVTIGGATSTGNSYIGTKGTTTLAGDNVAVDAVNGNAEVGRPAPATSGGDVTLLATGAATISGDAGLLYTAQVGNGAFGLGATTGNVSIAAEALSETNHAYIAGNTAAIVLSNTNADLTGIGSALDPLAVNAKSLAVGTNNANAFISTPNNGVSLGVNGNGVNLGSGDFTLTANGAISQSAAIVANSVNVTATTGAITLTNAGNTFSSVTASTSNADADFNDSSGSAIGGASVGLGTFTLSAGGPITQTGSIAADALNVSTTSGDITLTNGSNAISNLVVSTGATGNATIDDTLGFSITSASVGAELQLSAGGEISQAGALSAGTLNVSAGSNSITLNNSGNAFGGLAVSTTSDASFTDSTGVQVGQVNVGGTFTLTAGGAITEPGTISAPTVDVSTTSGAITLNAFTNDITDLSVSTTGSDNATVNNSGGINIDLASVGGTLALSVGGPITQSGAIGAGGLQVATTSGDITLMDASNKFGSLNVTTGASGNASFDDTGDLSITGGSVGNALNITTTGAVSQTFSFSANSLDVTAASVNLASVANTFATLTLSTTGDASVSDADALQVDSAGVGGTFILSTGGALTQTGAITAATFAVASNLGTPPAPITLDNSGNSFGHLSVTTGGTDNASIFDSTAVVVDGVGVGGTLTLTAGGGITQDGSIKAGGLDVSTTTGAITLQNAGNSFADLTVGTTGSDNAAITDKTGVNVDSATVGGTFTLAAGGAITQSGAIIAAGLDVSTTAGAITLQNSGNSFADLTVGTTGSDNASITDKTGVTVGTSGVGGTFTLAAGGAIGQSGAITAGGLDVSTTTGAITLNDAANAFGNLTVSTTGSDNASITDSTGVNVGTSGVGGAFTLVAGGAITQSGAITATALDVSTSTGAITLQNSGNSFADLTVGTTGSDNASITDKTGVNVDSATVGGTFTLAAGGAITQSGAITAAGLHASTTTGAITLNDASNAFGNLTVSTTGSDNASVTDSTGVTVGTSGVGGTFTLAAGGAIGQNGAITATTLDVSTTTGAITLQNGSNAFADLTVGTTGSDNASITDKTGVNVDSATVGGTFTLAAGGAITQSGAIIAAGLDVSTTTGAITLQNSGNSFADLTVGTTGSDNASITDKTGVTVGTSGVGGTFTLAAGGAIGQSGAITAGGLDVSTTTGAITLNDAANAFGNLTVSTTGSDNASITDSTGVNVGTSGVGGTFTLVAGGAVTQSGAITATALDVSTTTGAITLQNGGNSFADLTVGTTGSDNASITDKTGVNVDSATVGGTFTLAAGGAITQSGAITAAGLHASTTTGAITLNDAGNAFGNLTVSTTGSDNASVTDSTGVTVGTSGVGGTFTLAAGGAIGQNGAITATTLDVSTTTGAITLQNSGNSFADLTVGTTGSDNASITDKTGVNVDSATVGGTFTLAAGGAITQSGAIIAAGLDVSTTAGAITLQNSGNSFAALTVGTTGSDNATITDKTGVTVGTSGVGGTFTLAAGGAIGQSGAIGANTLDVSTSTGAITLTNAGNAIGNLTVSTTGSDNASITDSTALNVNSATVGGSLTLAAAGAITQTNAITAAALSVSTTTGNITLTNAGNAFATVSATTGAAGNATIVDNTDPVISGANVGGTFTFSSDASITQTGAILAGALVVSTTSGDITLTNAGNSVGALTITPGSTGNASFTNSTGLQVVGATTNETFTLSAGGPITQSGIIAAGTLNVSTTSGAITLANAGNAFYTLNVTTHGSDAATIADGTNNLAVASASTGGNLTLLSKGNLNFGSSVQLQNGSLLAVAGWDGTTTAPASLTTGNAYGNNGGSITVGGASAAGNVAVGSSGGSTTLAGLNVTVAGQHGYAQVGYHGGGATGNISIVAKGIVSLTGGAAGDFAQIGDGGEKTNGNDSGNVTVAAVGNVTLTGGSGAEAYAQIGHGGAEANAAATGYSYSGTISVSGANVALDAGTGSASYAQIGLGGYRVGENLASGTATNNGAVTVTSGHIVSLLGNGPDAYAQIGNGGDEVNTHAAVGTSGNNGGNIVVKAPNGHGGSVTLTAGSGADSYAQIGNGGYEDNAPNSAKSVNFTDSGTIMVTDLTLTGSDTGPNAFAQVGNGDAAASGFANVSGDITIDAFGHVIVDSGTQPGSGALIGNDTGTGTISGLVFGYTTIGNDPASDGLIDDNSDNTGSPGIPTYDDLENSIDNGDNGNNGAGGNQGSQPGPLEDLTDNSGDHNGGGSTSADDAARALGQSLNGQVQPSGVLVIIKQLLEEYEGDNNRHGVPPADADYSSWGNEALWQ